jgi:hypothetical protein
MVYHTSKGQSKLQAAVVISICLQTLLKEPSSNLCLEKAICYSVPSYYIYHAADFARLIDSTLYPIGGSRQLALGSDSPLTTDQSRLVVLHAKTGLPKSPDLSKSWQVLYHGNIT